MPNESGMPFPSDASLGSLWMTRMVELSHRGLMYSVQAATGMINDISDLATSLWESPSSRVSGSEETPIPERQADTVLPYHINSSHRNK